MSGTPEEFAELACLIEGVDGGVVREGNRYIAYVLVLITNHSPVRVRAVQDYASEADAVRIGVPLAYEVLRDSLREKGIAFDWPDINPTTLPLSQ